MLGGICLDPQRDALVVLGIATPHLFRALVCRDAQDPVILHEGVDPGDGARAKCAKAFKVEHCRIWVFKHLRLDDGGGIRIGAKDLLYLCHLGPHLRAEACRRFVEIGQDDIGEVCRDHGRCRFLALREDAGDREIFRVVETGRLGVPEGVGAERLFRPIDTQVFVKGREGHRPLAFQGEASPGAAPRFSPNIIRPSKPSASCLFVDSRSNSPCDSCYRLTSFS
jgi:hypothetical protein